MEYSVEDIHNSIHKIGKSEANYDTAFNSGNLISMAESIKELENEVSSLNDKLLLESESVNPNSNKKSKSSVLYKVIKPVLAASSILTSAIMGSGIAKELSNNTLEDIISEPMHSSENTNSINLIDNLYQINNGRINHEFTPDKIYDHEEKVLIESNPGEITLTSKNIEFDLRDTQDNLIYETNNGRNLFNSLEWIGEGENKNIDKININKENCLDEYNLSLNEKIFIKPDLRLNYGEEPWKKFVTDNNQIIHTTNVDTPNESSRIFNVGDTLDFIDNYTKFSGIDSDGDFIVDRNITKKFSNEKLWIGSNNYINSDVRTDISINSLNLISLPENYESSQSDYFASYETIVIREDVVKQNIDLPLNQQKKINISDGLEIKRLQNSNPDYTDLIEITYNDSMGDNQFERILFNKSYNRQSNIDNPNSDIRINYNSENNLYSVEKSNFIEIPINICNQNSNSILFSNINRDLIKGNEFVNGENTIMPSKLDKINFSKNDNSNNNFTITANFSKIDLVSPYIGDFNSFEFNSNLDFDIQEENLKNVNVKLNGLNQNYNIKDTNRADRKILQIENISNLNKGSNNLEIILEDLSNNKRNYNLEIYKYIPKNMDSNLIDTSIDHKDNNINYFIAFDNKHDKNITLNILDKDKNKLISKNLDFLLNNTETNYDRGFINLNIDCEDTNELNYEIIENIDNYNIIRVSEDEDHSAIDYWGFFNENGSKVKIDNLEVLEDNKSYRLNFTIDNKNHSIVNTKEGDELYEKLNSLNIENIDNRLFVPELDKYFVLTAEGNNQSGFYYHLHSFNKELIQNINYKNNLIRENINQDSFEESMFIDENLIRDYPEFSDYLNQTLNLSISDKENNKIYLLDVTNKDKLIISEEEDYYINVKDSDKNNNIMNRTEYSFINNKFAPTIDRNEVFRLSNKNNLEEKLAEGKINLDCDIKLPENPIYNQTNETENPIYNQTNETENPIYNQTNETELPKNPVYNQTEVKNETEVTNESELEAVIEEKDFIGPKETNETIIYRENENSYSGKDLAIVGGLASGITGLVGAIYSKISRKNKDKKEKELANIYEATQLVVDNYFDNEDN